MSHVITFTPGQEVVLTCGYHDQSGKPGTRLRVVTFDEEHEIFALETLDGAPATDLDWKFTACVRPLKEDETISVPLSFADQIAAVHQRGLG